MDIPKVPEEFEENLRLTGSYFTGYSRYAENIIMYIFCSFGAAMLGGTLFGGLQGKMEVYFPVTALTIFIIGSIITVYQAKKNTAKWSQKVSIKADRFVVLPENDFVLFTECPKIVLHSHLGGPNHPTWYSLEFYVDEKVYDLPLFSWKTMPNIPLLQLFDQLLQSLGYVPMSTYKEMHCAYIHKNQVGI